MQVICIKDPFPHSICFQTVSVTNSFLFVTPAAWSACTGFSYLVFFSFFFKANMYQFNKLNELKRITKIATPFISLELVGRLVGWSAVIIFTKRQVSYTFMDLSDLFSVSSLPYVQSNCCCTRCI